MSSGTTGDSGETKKLTAIEEAECIERTKLFKAGAAALTEFTSRLGGGGFGDLRIEGSKANGHEELFKLREQLSKIQEDLSKTSAKQVKASRSEEGAEDDTSAASQKTTKMSGNSAKAMRNVVKTETEDAFRDINIKFENLEKRVQKAEDENVKLREQLKKVESKAKKGTIGSGSTGGPDQGELRAMGHRVEKLEDKLRPAGELRTTQNTLVNNFNIMKTHIHDNPDSIEARIQEHDEAIQLIRRLCPDCDGSENHYRYPYDRGSVGGEEQSLYRVRKCRREVAELQGEVDSLSQAHETFQNEANDDIVLLEYRINKLRDWLVWSHNVVMEVLPKVGMRRNPDWKKTDFWRLEGEEDD
ncbi:hypothetical protein HII31_06449 [Pseudocercospora fuligena]|uniref:Uncharacterized protein n=1 Tax=Pseudocercospora fuligena TaxID=685502 RepID=A0A8H6VJ76_9PEZI|nr:hypothetical protein HII31_06449 [Pseudocercospora fuligena]